MNFSPTTSETMKYHLRIEEHEEYKWLGGAIITPNRRDYHDPAISGLTLAHDIIEHTVIPHQDPFIDELMALGGLVAGRGSNGLFPNGLAGIIRDLLAYDPDAFMENSQYPNNKKLKDPELYHSIIKAVEEVNGDIDEEDHIPFNQQLVTSWICEGYQRFKNRFRRYDLYDVSNHMFDTIAKKVDDWLKYAELGDEADLFVRFSDYYVDLVVDDY